jgi:hypothetical protein
MAPLKKILPLTALIAVALPAGSAMAAPKPKVQLSAPAYAVAENGGAATITVIRPRSGHSTVRLNQPVSVDYSTADGTAKAGSDYTAASGTLTFPACPGSPAAADPCVQQTFSIPVIDNSIVDGPRTLTVNLSNPTSPTRPALLGYPSSAVVVIADDDGSGVGAASTFQMAAASEYVSESSPSADVYVIRSGNLASGATVNYATSDGAAHAGTDYTAVSSTLTFPDQTTDPVASIIQTVQVPLMHNPASTPQLRDFTFGLDVPSGTGNALGSPSSENVMIVNSDGPATLLWSAPTYTTRESSSPVRLTAIAVGSITGNAEVDVDYRTVDGSAKAGVNYIASSGTLQFFAGDFAETVDIPILDDGRSGDKAFRAELLNQSAGTAIGDPGTATVNVVDAGGRSNEPAAGNGAGALPERTAGGTPQSPCGLVIKAAKAQKLLKQKGLKLQLRSTKSCKVTVTTAIRQLKPKPKSKKRPAQIVRTRVLKGKQASLALAPGKAKTVTVTFTKKTIAAIRKALRTRNKLVATVVVTERDSASRLKRTTLKITIRR